MPTSARYAQYPLLDILQQQYSIAKKEPNDKSSGSREEKISERKDQSKATSSQASPMTAPPIAAQSGALMRRLGGTEWVWA